MTSCYLCAIKLVFADGAELRVTDNNTRWWCEDPNLGLTRVYVDSAGNFGIRIYNRDGGESYLSGFMFSNRKLSMVLPPLHISERFLKDQ